MQLRSVAVSLLLAGLLYAQNTATLLVTVLDPSGAVIPRAVIELTTASGAHMSAITDDSGRATLAPIPTGRASIHVVADGFAARDQSVNLKPGENRWQAKLPIATRKDEVEVALDKREELTDRNGTAFTTTLTPAQIDQLPDDPDEMEQVLKNMAGPGAAMRVDGFMGGRLPHKSQIASIRFRLSAYNAEDHDLGFNIVDITTKPGFGAWHGSALFGYGGDTFNARNFFAPVREPQQNRRVDLSLSGPLRRNKTSASLAFDKTFSYDSKTTVGVTPLGSFADLVRLPLDMSSFQARIQNSWHKTHVLRGEYQYYTQTRSNIGNFDRPDRLFSNGQSMNVLRLSDSGAVSEKVLNEVRFQTQWITSTAKSATQSTAIVVPGAFSTGGAGFDSRREARETELRDDVSFNVKNHSLRVGLQFDAGRFRDRDTTNANGTFQFASLADYLAGHPLTFTQRVGNVPVIYDRYDFGGYIQDDLRLTKNFSLSAGVRWEAQTHVAGRNHFAPRAGFAWSPFKRAKTVIRGGGGIFYQWFGADIYEQTLRVNGFNQSDLVIVNPGYPDPLAGGTLASQLPPSIYRRDPLLNLPYFLRTSLGVQQQISKVMLTVDARLEHGLHMLWADNLNAPVPGIGRPNPLAGNIFDIQSGASSNRKQLHVGLSSAPGSRGPQRRVLWFFNYVLTKQIDEVSSALLSPSNPFNLRADRGPSIMDARHRFFALANGTIGKGFQLGANFHSNSAMPYNITTGFDNNGDTVINDRPAGVGRNSLRGSGLWDLSTRLSWTKGIGRPNGEGPPTMIMIRAGDTSGDIPTLPGQKPSKYQLQVYTQAYNVFNHANLSNYVGVLTSPLFGEPTSAGPGRRIELGIKFAF